MDRQEDKVIITVGSAVELSNQALPSLTSKAREIMAKIAEQNTKGEIVRFLVMGHTDNVPLTFGSQTIRDNWDLAAARSASVVQQLSTGDSLRPKKNGSN